MSVTRPTELLQVKRLSENAVLPARGSQFAAGFDLASAENTVVPAGGKALVKTDLSIAIPLNTYARIAPRSGLALKKHIDVGAGVVDYDYRGPVGVVLFNHGSEDFPVSKGDRVAQLILERICMADVMEVDALPETDRGAGGFGSTGVEEALPAGKRSRSHPEAADAEAAAGLEPGVGRRAQLLCFLSGMTQRFPAEETLFRALKPLVLRDDENLLAAYEAFCITKDYDDLLHTLKLLDVAATSKPN